MNNTELKSPSGLLKMFFKIPVIVARMGFSGWERLFGIEWMLLTTIGRKSGKKRYTMVDVLLFDRMADKYITVVSPKAGNSTLKTENGYGKFMQNEANPGTRKQVVLPEPPHQEKRCQRAS